MYKMNLGKSIGALFCFSLFSLILSSIFLSHQYVHPIWENVPESRFATAIPDTWLMGTTQKINFNFYPDDIYPVRVVMKDAKGNELSAAEGEIGLENKYLSLPVPVLGSKSVTSFVTITALNEEYKSQITLRQNKAILLETDKPIYQPSQVVRIRVFLVEASSLLPVEGCVDVEIIDPKGTKLSRFSLIINENGTNSADFQLASETTSGMWSVLASEGHSSVSSSFFVEKYSLPKFSVTLETKESYVLLGKDIPLRVCATYTYGEDVRGNVTVNVYKYGGMWISASEKTTDIHGCVSLTLPPVIGPVASPSSDKRSTLRLVGTVIEEGSGYILESEKQLAVAECDEEARLVCQNLDVDNSWLKPSTTHTCFVFLSSSDHVTHLAGEVKVTTVYNVADKESITPVEEETSVVVKDGMGKLLIRTPDHCVGVTVKGRTSNPCARFEETYSILSNPSSAVIHVQPLWNYAEHLVVGKDVELKVISTVLSPIFYEVLGRGKAKFPIMSGMVEQNDFLEATISLTLSNMMSPSAELVVYQLHPSSNELIADSVVFFVDSSHSADGVFSANFLSKGKKANTVLPGSAVQLFVSSTDSLEDAAICVRSVDRAVGVASESRASSMSMKRVFDHIEQIFAEPKFELHEGRFFGNYPYPARIGTSDIFKSARLRVIVSKGIEVQSRDEIRMNQKWMLLHMGVDDAVEESAGAPGEDLHVRQSFPETWIWEAFTLKNGVGRIEATAPDSITSFDTDVFALSRTKGMMQFNTSLTIFQPFFVSVDSPSSLIHGEEVEIPVTVYSYREGAVAHEFSVSVVEPFDGFLLLSDEQCSKGIPNGKLGVLGMCSFLIKPTRSGEISPYFVASFGNEKDAIRKTIMVEPAGVARESYSSFSGHVPGEFRENVSLHSEKMTKGHSYSLTVSITSDVMVQVIEGMDSLVQVPFGCGEQNMMTMAPGLYVLKYLHDTGENQKHLETVAKAESAMMLGYQRELTFRHNDGSFSAFGEQDESGSLWLTAYVVRVLSETSRYIFIDSEVLCSSVEWMIKHQRSDGSFDNVGQVFHREMMGESSSDDVSITAFLSISLMSYRAALSPSMPQLDNAIKKATGFVANRISVDHSTYVKSISCYTLALVKELSTKMESLCTSTGSELQERTPTSVESAGYLLLAYSNSKLLHLDSAKKVFQFLCDSRNPRGGFFSTQDTCVALEGMSMYSSRLDRSAKDTTVQLSVIADFVDNSQKSVHEFVVDSSNFDVVQEKRIPVDSLPKLSSLELLAGGKGNFLVQVVERWYEPHVEMTANGTPYAWNVNDECHFSINLNVDYRLPENILKVGEFIRVVITLSADSTNKACEDNNRIAYNGMTVVDVALPSGFSAVESSLEEMKNLHSSTVQRIDRAGRKVVIYVNDVRSGKTILQFDARALYVIKTLDTFSRVYSYYEPHRTTEAHSTPLEVRAN